MSSEIDWIFYEGIIGKCMGSIVAIATICLVVVTVVAVSFWCGCHIIYKCSSFSYICASGGSGGGWGRLWRPCVYSGLAC